MPLPQDTIVAIATAQQNAGVGIVRLSGPQSPAILKALYRNSQGHVFQSFKPRVLIFGQLVDSQQQVLDEAMVVWMPAPHSFTGEDVVELHCHGNIHLLRTVVKAVIACDSKHPVRMAEPGEFTKRAFLNQKMDLTQAEAVQDLIASESEQSYRANLKNLDGALSRAILSLREQLLVSLALVEASFEFPEEDIQTYDANNVQILLKQSMNQLATLKSAFLTSKLYDEGVRIAIVGPPNVGKSSLLNAFLLEDRAIVADIAGTTRDVVSGSKIIQGLRFHFSDTAGLRETSDLVEAYGIEKSKDSAQIADLVIYLTDNIDDVNTPVFSNRPHLVVLNKSDRLNESELLMARERFAEVISTHQADLVEKLQQRICTELIVKNVQSTLHVNERQHVKIEQAAISVQNILDNWSNLQATELLAEEIRHLVLCLDEITGRVCSEDVLGEIFLRFCIGK